MPSLHHPLPAVHLPHLRLDAVLSMVDRPQGVTVAAIAHDFGTSVPSLYRWRRRLYAALSDAPPGPSPRAFLGSLSQNQRALLEAAASASAATLSLRERRAWILQLHGEGVSVRGIRDVLLRRFGPAESLSVGAIEASLKQAGRIACSLLVTLVRPVLDRVITAAGDDIYLHGQAVKVLMEPVSGVILQTLRWHERDAEVWDLLLSQYPALKLFVGDGAREFDAAAEMRKLLRGLDLMHERQWWTRKVFRRLSAMEQACAEQLVKLRKKQAKGEDLALEIARTEKARRAIETAFYQMVGVEEQVVALFRPVDAEGRRWSEAGAQAVVNGMIDVLAKMSDAAGMKPVVDAAYGHVLSSSPGYVAHHRLWEDVPVELRAEATWTREQVLDVLEQARQAGQKAREGGSSGWQKWWHQNTERKLLEQVQAQVETLGATQAAIESLLRHPRRSSSLVESFNARVRVLQMSRRNVSDRLLGLAALQWNVEKREEGPRRGTSPYSLLGVLEEADERRWWEVLLDAQEEEEKAPAQAA